MNFWARAQYHVKRKAAHIAVVKERALFYFLDLKLATTGLATVKESHQIVLSGDTQAPATIIICDNCERVLLKELGQIC